MKRNLLLFFLFTNLYIIKSSHAQIPGVVYNNNSSIRVMMRLNACTTSPVPATLAYQSKLYAQELIQSCNEDWVKVDVIGNHSGAPQNLYCLYRSDQMKSILPLNPSINIPGIFGPNSATAISAGGLPGYTFLWSTGSISQTITGVTNNNNYSVTVTDAMGCKSTTSTSNPGNVISCCIEPNTLTVINSPNGLSVYASPAGNNLFVNNDIAIVENDQKFISTGNIQYVNGIRWYQIYVPNNVKLSANGLPVEYGWLNGQYLNYSGCNTQNPSSLMSIGQCSRTDVTCYGGNTGSVTSGTISNTTGPVFYQWRNSSNMIVGTTASVFNLPAGNYTLTVNDNISSVTCSISISQPAASLSSTCLHINATCNSCNDGTVIAGNFINQMGNITYSWKNSDNVTVGNSASISNLSPGIYFLIATDNCNSYSCQQTILSPGLYSTCNFYSEFANYPNEGNQSLFLKAISMNAIPDPIKICADGSKGTYLIFENNQLSINTNNIKFCIQEDPNFQNKPVYGYFDQANYSYNGNQNLIKVYYNHPSFMDETGLFRQASIKIYDTGNNNAVIKIIPVQIYRAPVLFVHGLWGDLKSFKEMEEELVNSNFYPPVIIPTRSSSSALTLKVDYKETNSSNFSVNHSVIPKNIHDLLLRANSSGYSCSKVDVVCHSMGGLLTRLYLNGPYDPFKNNINKIITLNTPHFGTPIANVLQWHCFDLIARTLTILGNNCYGGAVEDLKVNSESIQYLNNINNQINKVPSHTIATTGILGNELLYNIVARIASYGPIDLFHIYSGESNDILVPYSSQKAGITLSEPAVSTLQGHLGSPKNSNVINAVKILINSDPKSSIFSQSGFISGVSLPQPADIINCSTGNNFHSPTMNDINIISPMDSSIYITGDSLNLNFQSQGNLNRLFYFIGNKYETVLMVDTPVSSINYKIKIGDSLFGNYDVLVMGADNNDFKIYKYVNLNINSSISADSIKITVDSLILNQYQSIPITIIAYYSDGSEKEIQELTSLSYSIDTNIAKVTNKFEVTANHIGTSYLKVTFNNKTDSCLVRTTNDLSLLKAIFDVSKFEICSSDSVQYLLRSIGNPASVQWSFPGGIPNYSTDFNPVIKYTTSGIYSATLYVSWPGKTDVATIKNCVNVLNCPVNLTTNLFLQGFYLGNHKMINHLYLRGESNDTTDCDSIIIELHSCKPPYDLIYENKTLLKTNGICNTQFDRITVDSFYIVIKHKHSLETWSAQPIYFNDANINYDFTLSDLMSYGNNLRISDDGYYSIASGDYDSNGQVDFTDYQTLINQLNNNNNYFNKFDLTGEGVLESADNSLLENNSNFNFNFIHP